MLREAMEPYGRALLDFHRGRLITPLLVERDDGEALEMPLDPLFRGADALLPGEGLALERCAGRTIDIGAGAGAISLRLQERNLDVLAVDVSPEACEVMRERGVRQVACADIDAFEAEPFDTAVVLGRTIGMAGDLSRLRRFMDDLTRLVRVGGRALINSLDVRRTDVPRHLAYQAANERAGRYRGQVRIRFEYAGERGPFVPWLHIDAETLRQAAVACGWTLDVLFEQPDGNYLADLRRGR